MRGRMGECASRIDLRSSCRPSAALPVQPLPCKLFCANVLGVWLATEYSAPMSLVAPTVGSQRQRLWSGVTMAKLRVLVSNGSRGASLTPHFVSDYNSRSRSEEHTSELQSQSNLVCRLLLEK